MKIKINEGNTSYFQQNTINSEDQSFLFEEKINKLNDELKIQKDINSKSKEYILVLENLISNLNNKEKKYIDDVNNKINEIHTLENKNAHLYDENQKLKNEVSILKKFKNEVLNSKSWKITKPLRFLISIFKKKK